MEFSRQEYWSVLLRPPPGDLSDPGMEPESPTTPALQADSVSLSHQGSPHCCSISEQNLAPHLFFFRLAYKTCFFYLPSFNPKQLHWFLCWSSNIAGSLLRKDLYLLFPLPGQLLLPGSHMTHSFPYFKSSFKYLIPSETFSDPTPIHTAVPATMTTSAHTLPICYGMNCVIREMHMLSL